MLINIILTLTLLFTFSSAASLHRGKSIYTIMCDKEKVSAITYEHKEALIKQITTQNLCGNLKVKDLDALAMFLTKKVKIGSLKPLTVPDKSRCPVCGMFIAKYPKWVASIALENGEKYYFDGVKDMMKFYFDPVQFHKTKKPIDKLLVTDYYTLEGLSAKAAYYVIGSNIYGPMGEEFIPFKTEADAKNFMQEHHGKRILTFDTIKENLLY